MRNPLHRVYLKSSTPFREVVDSRFADVQERFTSIDERLVLMQEQVTLVGESSGDTQEFVRALATQLGAELQRIGETLHAAGPGGDDEASITMDDIVRVHCLRHVCGTPDGASVLIAGIEGSGLPLSLANLGYSVVVLGDSHALPVHRGISRSGGQLGDHALRHCADAVLARAEGEVDEILRTARWAGDAARPGGLVVMSSAMDPSRSTLGSVDDLVAALASSLDGFGDVSVTALVRETDTEWHAAPPGSIAPGHDAVAIASARAPV